MLTWKWFYYAPNTYQHWRASLAHRPSPESCTLRTLGVDFARLDFVSKVLLPYAVTWLFLVPLAWVLVAGPTAGWSALVNIVVADLHSFIIVAPNHCGDDLYRFEESCVPHSNEFYLRAVLSSANYTTGGDWNDYCHGYLNYQVEHHLWPGLSMLQYQRAQPLVVELCRRYGVPYTQQPVLTRLLRTISIMVGHTSMRRTLNAQAVASR